MESNTGEDREAFFGGRRNLPVFQSPAPQRGSAMDEGFGLASAQQAADEADSLNQPGSRCHGFLPQQCGGWAWLCSVKQNHPLPSPRGWPTLRTFSGLLAAPVCPKLAALWPHVEPGQPPEFSSTSSYAPCCLVDGVDPPASDAAQLCLLPGSSIWPGRVLPLPGADRFTVSLFDRVHCGALQTAALANNMALLRKRSPSTSSRKCRRCRRSCFG